MNNGNKLAFEYLTICQLKKKGILYDAKFVPATISQSRRKANIVSIATMVKINYSN